MIKNIILSVTFAICTLGCIDEKSSDEVQEEQQERILKEGTSQIGMPNIVNFREKKLLKDILEMRDQSSLNTYTYLWSDVLGKKIFLCNSIGYAIPYATQFSSPQKIVVQYGTHGQVLPQADPNALFSPSSAEGKWVMCKDPKSADVKPIYIEPRIIVSPFEFSEAEACVIPVKK